jgi:HSP20 family protein
MPESKATRTDVSTGKETGQALARNERGMQRREPGAYASPFEFMNRMAEEMDRTFDRIFRDWGMPARSWLARMPFRGLTREGVWSPRIEAFQKGDRFIVRAELPGLKKDDVQVEVTEDAITIHGERQEQRDEEREGYYHTEREYGQFYRTIPLPEGVITDSAQATFNNGVLEISMQAPPAEATRGRRIEIKESPESANKK